MATSLKVDLVSRNIGSYRGQQAVLVCDAQLVNRAVDAIKGISKSMNVSPSAMIDDEEYARCSILDSLLDLMEGPAYNLLSDFRDTYTAPRDRIVEVRIDENDKRITLGIVPSLKMVDPVTVRICGIEVKVVPERA